MKEKPELSELITFSLKKGWVTLVGFVLSLMGDNTARLQYQSTSTGTHSTQRLRKASLLLLLIVIKLAWLMTKVNKIWKLDAYFDFCLLTVWYVSQHLHKRFQDFLLQAGDKLFRYQYPLMGACFNNERIEGLSVYSHIILFERPDLKSCCDFLWCCVCEFEYGKYCLFLWQVYPSASDAKLRHQVSTEFRRGQIIKQHRPKTAMFDPRFDDRMNKETSKWQSEYNKNFRQFPTTDYSRNCKHKPPY